MKKNYLKLKKSVKTRWLKALRSGKYVQGRNHLKQIVAGEGPVVVAHCCLGVLGEVEKVRLTKQVGFALAYWVSSVGGGMLTPKTCAKLQLDPDAQEFLADKNDLGWSFERIATWIEKTL